jgi:hypothetical protein
LADLGAHPFYGLAAKRVGAGEKFLICLVNAQAGIGRRWKRRKTFPKLKTPETEASGASILIPRSTTGCCVLRLSQGRTCSFRCRSFLGLRRLEEPSTFADCSRLRLDRWPTSPARIGVLSSSSTGGSNLRLSPAVRSAVRPPADPPAFAGGPPRARLATTSDSHLALILQLGWLNDLRLSPPAIRNLRLAPAAAATSSSHWLLPLLPNRQRTSDSHRLFSLRLYRFSHHMACAVWRFLRLGL